MSVVEPGLTPATEPYSVAELLGYFLPMAGSANPSLIGMTLGAQKLEAALPRGALPEEPSVSVDLKNAKYNRPEAPGVDRLIAGIAMRHRDDESRLQRRSAVFDDLYEYFSRKRG